MMIGRVGILAGLVLADVATTEAVLRTGGVELNPVMIGVAPDLVIHLLVKVLLVVALVAVLEIGMRGYDRFRDRGYFSLWTLYGGIMLNNSLQFLFLSS